LNEEKKLSIAALSKTLAHGADDTIVGNSRWNFSLVYRRRVRVMQQGIGLAPSPDRNQ
jgi:hypothetical protein